MRRRGNSRRYYPARRRAEKAKKPVNSPDWGLPYDFTIFGNRPFLAVKISLERGCFWEGRGGEIWNLVVSMELRW